MSPPSKHLNIGVVLYPMALPLESVRPGFLLQANSH